VAAIGVAVHDRGTTTEFDTWASRPIFAHIGEHGRVILLALSSPLITMGALAVIAVLAAVSRRWSLVTLAVVGPAVAVVVTEYVLKPIVHRHIYGGPGGYAYPSGHETGLVSLIVVLFVLLPSAQLGRGLTALVAAMLTVWAALGAVGLVRGHYHFPADTIGGIGVAVACVLGAALVIDLVVARADRPQRSRAAQFT
jgi:undecaprenyl-diphosphatase